MRTAKAAGGPRDRAPRSRPLLADGLECGAAGEGSGPALIAAGLGAIPVFRTTKPTRGSCTPRPWTAGATRSRTTMWPRLAALTSRPRVQRQPGRASHHPRRRALSSLVASYWVLGRDFAGHIGSSSRPESR